MRLSDGIRQKLRHSALLNLAGIGLSIGFIVMFTKVVNQSTTYLFVILLIVDFQVADLDLKIAKHEVKQHQNNVTEMVDFKLAERMDWIALLMMIPVSILSLISIFM